MAAVNAETVGAVGVARLNRPEARNALSPELMAELVELVERWDADSAMELAEVVARRPPFAVRLGKQAVLAADETPLAAGLDQERRLYELAMATEDRVEGMNAFIEKRRPQFHGM